MEVILSIVSDQEASSHFPFTHNGRGQINSQINGGSGQRRMPGVTCVAECLCELNIDSSSLLLFQRPLDYGTIGRHRASRTPSAVWPAGWTCRSTSRPRRCACSVPPPPPGTSRHWTCGSAAGGGPTVWTARHRRPSQRPPQRPRAGRHWAQPSHTARPELPALRRVRPAPPALRRV